MLIHMVFDLMAWASAGLLGWWIARRGWLSGFSARRPFKDDPYYFLALAMGAIAGAILFGSFNMGLAGFWTVGHSIAGAIAGGVARGNLQVAARHPRLDRAAVRGAAGARHRRRAAWAASSRALPDYTYGTPTSLPWAVDFGDGIRRHPVQLYESAAMLPFLVVLSAAHCTRNAFVHAQWLLSLRGVVCSAALRLGVPEALSGGDRTVQYISPDLRRIVRLQRFMMRGRHDLRAAV